MCILYKFQTECQNTEWQRAHAELQREHLELQQKHCNFVFKATAAEGTQQTIEELQAKLMDLQEELSTVQLDRNRYWEDYRKELIINSKLMQVCLAMSASPFVPRLRALGVCWPSSFRAEWLCIHV